MVLGTEKMWCRAYVVLFQQIPRCRCHCCRCPSACGWLKWTIRDQSPFPHSSQGGGNSAERTILVPALWARLLRLFLFCEGPCLSRGYPVPSVGCQALDQPPALSTMEICLPQLIWSVLFWWHIIWTWTSPRTWRRGLFSAHLARHHTLAALMKLLKISIFSWVWWHMFVIPAL